MHRRLHLDSACVLAQDCMHNMHNSSKLNDLARPYQYDSEATLQASAQHFKSDGLTRGVLVQKYCGRSQRIRESLKDALWL